MPASDEIGHDEEFMIVEPGNDTQDQQQQFSNENNFDQAQNQDLNNQNDDQVENAQKQDGSKQDNNQQQDNSQQDQGQQQESEVELTPEEQDVQYFTELSERTGFEIQNDDDVETALMELAQYRDREEQGEQTDPYANLPKDLQLAIQAYNSGGNYRSAMELASKDFDKMSDRDVLFEQYLRTNPEIAKRGVDVAKARFGSSYKTDFGILDEYSSITDQDEKDEFLQNNKNEIENAEKFLKGEVDYARSEMQKYQSEHAVPEDTGGYSEEEVQQYLQQHQQSVDNVIRTNTGVNLPFGENGESVYTMGVSEEQAEEISGIMNSPADFFEDVLGIQLRDASVSDYEKFYGIVAYIQNIDRIVENAGKYYVENMDKQTVEQMLHNPPQNKSNTEKTNNPIQTEEEQLVSAFNQHYQSTRKKK